MAARLGHGRTRRRCPTRTAPAWSKRSAQGVETALLGLRVWIWEAAYQRPDGTAQETAIVPARQLVMLPDSASFDLGASLGIPFLTAHRA